MPIQRFHPLISENVKAQRKTLREAVDIHAIRPSELCHLDRIRPRRRADCEPCEMCQREMEWRSTGGDPHGVLICGHAEPLCHARPCPFVGCRYNLAADVTAMHRIVITDDPEALEETCALDVADRGPITLEAIGVLLRVTRERVRQLEERIEARLRRRDETLPLRTLTEVKKLEDYRE